MRLPPEALTSWKFHRDPFADEPRDFDELYWSAEHTKLRDHIRSTIRNAEGTAISAPVGWGKTFVWLAVQDALDTDENAGYLVSSVVALKKDKITANTIQEALFSDLEDKARRCLSSESISRGLVQILKARARKESKHIVLFIDEAHHLRDDALRALKNLLDIRAGIRRVLSVVLLGQEELAAMWGAHGRREVVARIPLVQPGPLSIADREVEAFIRWRLFIALYDVAPISVNDVFELETMFDDEAFRAIEQELAGEDERKRARTDLLTVATIASHALAEAWNNGEERVNEAHVRKARNRLTQGVH